jgi:Spy/CpxP family protein refolding chaperone
MKPYNKILVIAVVVLLLTNLGLLFFMWKGKHTDQSKRQPATNSAVETMARELNMTESQKKNYQVLRDEHFARVRPLFDSIREARKDFLKMIQSPIINDSSVQAYSHRIAEKQAVIDRMTLDHFRKVRGLFSGEQQKKFDDFIQKMMLRRRDTTNRR